MTLDHIGAWGRSQSGKTTLVKRALAARKRVVVFDFQSEYHGPGWVRVTNLRDLARTIAARDATGYRIAYDISGAGGSPSDLLDKLGKVLLALPCRRLYFAGRHPRVMTLVAEELAECFPNRPGKEHSFARLSNMGRHYGIALIGTSQRLAEVRATFRNATSYDYFLPLGSEPDYAAAVKIIGRSHAATMKKLQPLQFLCVHNGQVSAGRLSYG